MSAVSPLEALLKQMTDVLEHVDAQTSFNNSNAREVFDHCAQQIRVATMKMPHHPYHPVFRVGEDTYTIQPASCVCGGSFAWLRERPSGAWEMVGCICHNLPNRAILDSTPREGTP